MYLRFILVHIGVHVIMLIYAHIENGKMELDHKPCKSDESDNY